MSKVILWIVVVFAILFVLRLLTAAKAKRGTRDSRQSPGQRTPEPGTMVRCVHCGVFLPKSEARPAPGGYACAEGKCSGNH